MSERPILFSGPLVREILAGRKSETRRPVAARGSKIVDACGDSAAWPTTLDLDRTCPAVLMHGGGVRAKFITPRVEVGDVLWVRETWRVTISHDRLASRDIPAGATVRYAADDTQRPRHAGLLVFGKTRPSIHMPRWAARLFLRVTEVRAERVKEIDDAGALREGIEGQIGGEQCPCCEGSGDFEDDPDPGCRNCESTGVVLTPREQFAQLWDSIYSTKRGLSWGENPWVWVIEFEHEVRP